MVSHNILFSRLGIDFWTFFFVFFSVSWMGLAFRLRNMQKLHNIQPQVDTLRKTLLREVHKWIKEKAHGSNFQCVHFPFVLPSVLDSRRTKFSCREFLENFLLLEFKKMLVDWIECFVFWKLKIFVEFTQNFLTYWEGNWTNTNFKV